MTEMTVEFKDIQESLEPFLGGKTVRIMVGGGQVTIVPQSKEKKVLKAKGALKAYADPAKIPGEEGAWERAVVEKYANRDI